MRRIALLLVLSLGLGALTFVGVRKLKLQAQPAGRNPFTAFTLERYYDGSGALVRSYNSIYAVRSDGSWVRIWPWQDPNGRYVEIREIWDFSAKENIGIDGLTDSVTTWPLSDGQVAAFRIPDKTCADDLTLERATLLGYEVVKVQRQTLQTSRKFVERDEFWLAPALDCFRLREVLASGTIGGDIARTTEREVIFVIPGEPSPALFQIPPDYTERSPSQVAAEFARRFGRKVMSDAQLKLRDEIYHTHQKNR